MTHRWWVVFIFVLLGGAGIGGAETKRLVFEGIKSEHQWTLKELDFPADWSSFRYLALELRASTPQRFHLIIRNKDGLRRIVIQPFGQNVWFRAAVPLRFFQGRDEAGYDMASVYNKPTNSFWMSTWGPYGPLNAVEALSIMMEYPLNKPVLEVRSIQLRKEDPGSEILEKLPVIDEFGQWIHADWPRKVKNLEQLKTDWAAEETTFTPVEFKYCQYRGYLGTKAKATGFFRVEQIEGRWWFIDPDGHLFLSIAVPGLGAGGVETRIDGREKYYAALPPENVMASLPGGRRPATGIVSGNRWAAFRAWNLFRRYGPEWPARSVDMEARRVEGWGLTTGAGPARPGDSTTRRPQPYLARFNTLPRGGTTAIPMFLGLPDVYSDEFARFLDESAAAQCAPRKNDQYLIGYFIGNEPPWPRRESELIDMFLAGPSSAMQRAIKEYLAEGDTPERRRQFVLRSFEKYLSMCGAALKKHDPNHLNLGIRFGGIPPEYLSKMAHVFDVFSINIYEYSPVSVLKRSYELAGRPIIIGEFHFGVPADGLGAGLVQVRDQKERGVAYRYFVEQAAALNCFVGSGWFTGIEEPVTGRMDGENYNIGFLDVTDRAYTELVTAAKETHKQLLDVHSGRVKPFSQRPKASDAGTPETPWTDEEHNQKLK